MAFYKRKPTAFSTFPFLRMARLIPFFSASEGLHAFLRRLQNSHNTYHSGFRFILNTQTKPLVRHSRKQGQFNKWTYLVYHLKNVVHLYRANQDP